VASSVRKAKSFWFT